jgi:hypothetical protein
MADQNPAAAAVPAAAAPEGAADSSPAHAHDPHTPRARLLDQAKVDSDNAARIVQTRNDFARRGELLMKAVPDKYLELVVALRAAVRLYNDALQQQPENPIPTIHWFESPNVTLREPLLGDGMRIRMSRVQSNFELVLRFVNRNNKPDVPLIEGYGNFGREVIKRKVLMRIEGWVEHGEVIYWYNLDFKRQSTPLTEVPERIVMAVATGDYSHLSRDYEDHDEAQGNGPSS